MESFSLLKDWYNKINLWKQYVFNTCWDNIEFISISRHRSDFSLAEDLENPCGCLSLRSVCHHFISHYLWNSEDLKLFTLERWSDSECWRLGFKFLIRYMPCSSSCMFCHCYLNLCLLYPILLIECFRVSNFCNFSFYFFSNSVLLIWSVWRLMLSDS